MLVPIEHVPVAVVLIDNRWDTNVQVVHVSSIELGPIDVIAFPVRWIQIEEMVSPRCLWISARNIDK